MIKTILLTVLASAFSLHAAEQNYIKKADEVVKPADTTTIQADVETKLADTTVIQVDPESTQVDKDNLSQKNDVSQKADLSQKNDVSQKADLSQKNDVSQKADLSQKTDLNQKNDVSQKADLSQKNDVSQKADLSQKNDVSQKADLSQKNDVSQKADLSQKNNLSQKADLSQKNNLSQKADLSQKTDLSQKADLSQKNDVSQKADLSQKTDLSQKNDVSQKADLSQKNDLSQKADLSQKNDLSQKADLSQKNDLSQQADLIQKNDLNQRNSLYNLEQNYITIVGGGGEPKGAATTQFDKSIVNLSTFVNENSDSYKTNINFNGGHSETEKIIAEKYSAHERINGFDEPNFEKIVNEYIRKLTANPPEIKAGEKIILFISDHGGEKDKNTHTIAVSSSPITNMNNVQASETINLDFLAALTAAAQKANVKLAIIDGSCHSGNSLSLANDKTCVISASGPKHYGYGNFAEIFATRMKKGKNLENIFLETRNEINGNGFPEISTPEGMAVQDDLYPLLTPFMYFHGTYAARGLELDKLDTWLKDNAKSYDSQKCERKNDFDKLNNLITQLEDVHTFEKKSFFSKKIIVEKAVDLTELKKRIAKYREVQEKYLEALSSINLPDFNKKEVVTISGYMLNLTQKEIIGGNWAYHIANKNKDLQDPNLSEEKRKSLTISRDVYQVALDRSKVILAEHPEFQRYQNILNELKTNSQTSQEVATSIALEANKAYVLYYKNVQKKRLETDQAATNACKDFVL
jgi:hypothetical protein